MTARPSRLRARAGLAAGLVTALAWGLAAGPGCGTGLPASPELPVVDSGMAEVDSEMAETADASVSDAAEAAACDVVLPKCPGDAASWPSWSQTVSHIVATSCGGCHQDGGIEEPLWNFSTYAFIHMNAGEMLGQVYGCLMPPADAAPISSADTQTLLTWIVCGSPDN